MILNGYAVLDGFTLALRGMVALVVVVLALRGLHDGRRAASEGRTVAEDRNYLLFLLGFLLLFLNLAAWPILYLLLDSYVAEWPAVMCIYGVTQVGSRSVGVSHYLPVLLAALQVLKPALVFISGVWVVVYLVHRATDAAPLLGRILVLLVGVGLVATFDCGAEAAYLIIPKKEERPPAGCCMTAALAENRFAPAAIFGDNARGSVAAAYVAVNAGMLLGVYAAIRRLARQSRAIRIEPLLLGAALCACVSGVFLSDVAAPAWLRLPNHHCAYDLVERAPESIAGVAAFVLATFAVGWAWAASRLAAAGATGGVVGQQMRQLLVIGFFAYLGSLALVAAEFCFT